MNDLIQKESFIPGKTLEEDFVNLVKIELNDIKRSFFKIGFRLREANNNGYYKKLGFENISDCAETLFGFKKSTTYELMDIAFWFRSKESPMCIDPKYQDYNQSQLTLFNSINCARDSFIKMSSPSDSIAKLRKAKSYWNNLQRGKLNTFLGYGRCGNVDEFIEKTEEINPHLKETISEEKSKEPEQISLDENSGYPEKQEETIPQEIPSDIIIESQEDSKPEIFTVHKELSELLIAHCTEHYKHMSYKTIFDPDNKGLGVKVMPDHLSEVFVTETLKAFNCNRTEIKNMFTRYFVKRIACLDYNFLCRGKTIGQVTVMEKVAEFILDFIFEEWNTIRPKEEQKKGKKKK